MPTLTALPRDLDCHTLPNGARVLLLPMPHLASASVSLFVRTGSAHESRALGGVSHFVEHMVFKGTASASGTRDARRINRDAESLGAEVNAHTDKDHTAFHMRGLAEHAGDFVRMLGDIALHASFPAVELERERQVLLQEMAEEDDDPMAIAFRQFDAACWGTHAAARPVAGTRRQLETLTRDDLLGYWRQQYCASNIVLVAAGAIDGDAVMRAANQALAAAPAGAPHELDTPAWRGGVKTRAQSGSVQTHLVMGWPIAALRDDDVHAQLAAALLGEGMSSPLMDELREQRGLVYYAACSADVWHASGQFVIEASMAPQHVDEAVALIQRLMAAHAASIDEAELQRARNQLKVRQLRNFERPSRRCEDAALDLLSLGRVRSRQEWVERIDATSVADICRAFEGMLVHPVALAATGKLPRGLGERLRAAAAAR